jgi:5-methylcytosine-specific restriction endonuclease McrA
MSRDFFDFDAPADGEIRAEREKAKTLRKTRWWQQKTSSGLCHYCKKKVAYKNITMDHLVPLPEGDDQQRIILCPAAKTVTI